MSWRCISAPVLFLALLLNGVLTAQSRPQVLPTLTTAKAAHSLSIAEALRGYPVRLQAVATYYDATIDPRHVALFVTDASGSIFVVPSTAPAVAPKAGELLEITGVSGAGDFAPIVTQAIVRVIGASHLPLNPPRVGMTDLVTDAADGQWVEIEGVVHSVRESGKNVFLDMALRDGHLAAITVRQPGVDYAGLVDAKITLRGNEAPLFNGLGQLTGAHLFFPDLSVLHVEEAGALDPFQLPIDHVGGLLSYSPNAVFRHRVHLRGSITLLWPGRLLCIQDGLRGICAQTSQASSLNPGELADVVGFPLLGDFTPTLAQASYRASGGYQTTVAPAITPAEAFKGDHDSQLIEIEGQIIGVDRAADDPTLVLSSGNFVFTAVLPSESPADARPMLEEGSWVRVTGICSVHSDVLGTATGVGFSVAKSFRILMRSSADVVIVRKPSWWNAAHTLRVLELALLITVLALCSAVILSHRVRQQTAVIRAQLKETAALKDAAEAAHRAAEFQATHDGLTGVRNRGAILELLHREFELASRNGTTTGVMMLDLDHFKKVNDTYGHMAGDEVLKEAVRRILHSVRSTDLVGRYGGEEFLVVMPQCGREQVQACAERVRLAVSREPIRADGSLVSTTTSVGATLAISPFHTEQQALAASDIALYDAKNSGRNQVIFLDMEVREKAEPPSSPRKASTPLIGYK